MPEDPTAIVERALEQARVDLATPVIADPPMRADIDYLCHCSNRAGVRLVMACLLAKIHDPHRNPYPCTMKWAVALALAWPCLAMTVTAARTRRPFGGR